MQAHSCDDVLAANYLQQKTGCTQKKHALLLLCAGAAAAASAASDTVHSSANAHPTSQKRPFCADQPATSSQLPPAVAGKPPAPKRRRVAAPRPPVRPQKGPAMTAGAAGTAPKRLTPEERMTRRQMAKARRETKRDLMLGYCLAGI